jgi:glycosyltransferase involved in cell wall biosynthesis
VTAAQTPWHHKALVPRVTVILPTYNWSAVLRLAVGSVLHQTYRDFELLVVGDHCTDDSAEVVAACGDARVRWINLPANTGHQSGPNNEGLRQATGELIAYLGHDDLWLPHHLEVAVAALDAQAGDLSYTLALQVPPAALPWVVVPRPQVSRFASPLSIVHRRSVTAALGGWRRHTELRRPPDVELWARIAAAGRPVTFVPRLTGIKFPARYRRDVYIERPSHEQAAWWARVLAEPDLEPRLLAGVLTSDGVLGGRSCREVLTLLRGEVTRRVTRRIALPGFGSDDIDTIRRFKGIEGGSDAGRRA